MKKLALIIFTSLIICSANAEAVEKLDRWQELMNLVSQEMKILETAKHKGHELYYRMLELHSEKLKLIHEKNNKEFLDKSKVTNVIKEKESFFKGTRAYYNFTKEFGLKVIRDFPTNQNRAEVTYALGLNSRDYGQDGIAEKYLLETISLVKDPHHSLRHHAETALADHYYNEKRFSEAIHYYERVIKISEDEWLPKHHFNVSWCYLKNREFDKAIKAIIEAYTLSKNRIYVNIKDQVLDNIGSFYVYADRPMEGLEFYLINEKDPIPYLMPMAHKTSEKGHQRETEAVLAAAQKLIDKNDWFHYQEELFHSYLDFYRHYNRFSDHEETSKKMVSFYQKADTADKQLKAKLKTDLREDSIEKMRSVAGFLQVKLAKNMKDDGGSFKTEELDIVLNYYKHLIALDQKRKVEYLYFKGETYYSVHKFLDSAPAYIAAVNEAKLVKNNELARKSLNSLLALTAMEVMEKELNKKYLIYAYSEHIGFWPKDDKSELIYPKLFEIYRERGDDEKASVVIRAFNKAYPELLKDQQILMTKVLDLFIERKETKKLAGWIHEFKAGFLAFSKDTIEKTEITLGNMLFMEYQELARQGDKLAAAKGFESIFQNKLYTAKVKSQSAFFAALTYLELGETQTSFKWQVLAFENMNAEEREAKRDEELKMAQRTYKLQDFVTSFKISKYFLDKFCSKKDEIQNRFYEVAVMTALVEENSTGAENIIQSYSGCLKKPEIRQKALTQMYSFYEKRGDFRGLRLHVHRYPTEEFKNHYRFTLQKWFWEKSSLNLKDLIRQEFKALKNPETTVWLKEMDEFKRAENDLAELKSAVIWDRPVFDGEAYNKALDGHLFKIDNFKKNYQHLTSSTQIDLAILSTRMFSELYFSFGDAIQNMKPAGMDFEILKSFQTAMKKIGSQFLIVSRQFDEQLDKALNEKETLVWGSRSIASLDEIENPVFSNVTGLTMDKSRE